MNTTPGTENNAAEGAPIADHHHDRLEELAAADPADAPADAEALAAELAAELEGVSAEAPDRTRAEDSP
ncbi:MAG: hypothetical protein QNJ88_17885 [Acidimicrobiia bacterium]|nr:hypothetical protein [Acidimicrobiia bacterium]